MSDLNGDRLRAEADAAIEAAYLAQGYEEEGASSKTKLAEALVGPIGKAVADTPLERDKVSITRGGLMQIAFPGVPGRDEWGAQENPDLARLVYDGLDGDVWRTVDPGPTGLVQVLLNGENAVVLVRRRARKNRPADVYVTRNRKCLMEDVVAPQNAAEHRHATYVGKLTSLLMQRVPKHAKEFDKEMTRGLNDAKNTAKQITAGTLAILGDAEPDGE